MTETTDAEIEAAAKAIYFCQNSIMFDHEENWQEELKLHGKLWHECAKAALTAAAEVGPQHTSLTRQQLVDEIFKLNDLLTAERERCARIADSFFNDPDPYVSRKIAAAIRA